MSTFFSLDVAQPSQNSVAPSHGSPVWFIDHKSVCKFPTFVHVRSCIYVRCVLVMSVCVCVKQLHNLNLTRNCLKSF